MKKVEDALRAHILAAARRGRMPGHVLFCGAAAADRHGPVALAAKALALPVFRFIGGELKEGVQLKGLLAVPECGAIVVVEELDLLSGEPAGLLRSVLAEWKLPSFSDPGLTLYLHPLMVIGFTARPASADKKLLAKFSLNLGWD